MNFNSIDYLDHLPLNHLLNSIPMCQIFHYCFEDSDL